MRARNCGGVGLIVRPLSGRPEAATAARIFETRYGDAYPNPSVYAPCQIEREARLHTAQTYVAQYGPIQGTSPIYGVISLVRAPHNPKVVELARCVVDPEAPVSGVGNALVDGLIHDLTEYHSYFGLAVTQHTHSQKMLARLGMVHAGVLFGHLPAEATEVEV